MALILNKLREYNFILLWLAGGAVHKYLGALIVVFTFFLMLKKEMYDRALVSFWILLIFSDSTIGILGFSVVVKPIITLLLGGVSLLFFRKDNLKNRFIYPFLLFFCYIMISAIFHPGFINSTLTGLSYIIIYFFPPIFFLKINKEDKVEDLLRSFIFFGNLILFISLIIGLLFPSIGAQYGGRLNGIFRNPNGVGIFLALYTILSYIIFRTISFSKNTRRATLILVITLLFLSGARSSSGAIIIFFIGVWLSKKTPWIFVISTVCFFFVFEPLYDLIILTVYNLGYGEVFRLDTIQKASGRIYVWQAAWVEINNNFFFGSGFNYSENLIWLRNHYLNIPLLKAHDGNAHQSFLSLWMNNGIIGLLLFIIGWVITILSSLKKSKLVLAIVAALVFSASYESWMVASLNPFTIQMILIFTIILYFNNKSDERIENEFVETIDLLKSKQIRK